MDALEDARPTTMDWTRMRDRASERRREKTPLTHERRLVLAQPYGRCAGNNAWFRAGPPTTCCVLCCAALRCSPSISLTSLSSAQHSSPSLRLTLISTHLSHPPSRRPSSLTQSGTTGCELSRLGERLEAPTRKVRARESVQSRLYARFISLEPRSRSRFRDIRCLECPLDPRPGWCQRR